MTTRLNHDEQWRVARDLARRATLDLARHGRHATVRDVDPLAGLAASRQLELAAREHASNYVRAAREAGHSWYDVGTALGLVPGGDAKQAGETVAEAAFTFAAGHPDSETVYRYGRSVIWTCGSCDQVISDRGLRNGPRTMRPVKPRTARGSPPPSPLGMPSGMLWMRIGRQGNESRAIRL
jgi:hypothetical protein